MVYVANRKLDFSKIWVMREINERLTIKSQDLKWFFLNKVQKCILDMFGTRLEFFEPWKLHDKKSISTGAQKGVLN